MAEEPPYRIDVYKGFWAGLEQQPASQQERITEFMASRLLYEVDDDSRTVRIIYLGPHPEWEKLGKTRNL